MTETRLSYTRQEAAEVMGVSLDTIRRAIKAGTLRAKKKGRVILVSPDALRDWFNGLEDA